MKQGDKSISDFYNAVKTACDQLNMVGEEVSSRDRVMYFTDGVWCEFRVLVRVLFIQPDLSSFDAILPLFFQHEKWLAENNIETPDSSLL